jgi:hypothetical protein
MIIRIVLLNVALLGVTSSRAAEVTPAATNAPALLELRDQFDMPQRLAFPTTNVVVLTIADRKGSEQIDGWVAAIKVRYGGRVELRGLADVGGVPGLWRGIVRKKFQETRKHPVMMDWSGEVCDRLGYERNVANILLVGRDGAILTRFTGPASDRAIADLHKVLDEILACPARTARGSYELSNGPRDSRARSCVSRPKNR